MKRIKLFEVQSDLASYVYPILKIMICIPVIVLCILRKKIFHFSNTWINMVITLLCLVLTMASILCLYISVGEVFHTHENRKKQKYHPVNVRQLTIESITALVSENDIIEIEVCTNNKVIEIGASSECKYSSSIFERKLFYISSVEYETAEKFQEALLALFPQKVIPVLRIDGLPVD